MIRFRELLRDKNFLCLWLGQVISNFGDRLTQMALIAFVYQRKPGSEMALAKLIAFTIIPVFVIGPIAGAWVDRLNKKNIMIMSDILRGLLVLSIPFFIITGATPAIYVVIFITFSISRFFIPSKMAIIPDIVPKEKLLVANSLSDTTHMIGNVVGLVVAGVIVNIKFIGAIGGFYIDAVTFFVSAALIAMIVHKGFVDKVRSDLIKTSQALEESFRRSIFSEIWEGLVFIMSYRQMRFTVCALFILLAGIGAISCVIIVFIQGAFATATRDLGILGMFLASGLFAGTLLYGKFGQRIRRETAVCLSFMATGVAITLFTAFVRNYPSIFTGGALACLVGLAASPIMSAINTLTHEAAPEEVRGRIFSSLETVIHLAFMAFMFIAAFAAKYVDRSTILITVGVVFFAAGLWGVFTIRRA